jgi:hypothetical protein
MRWPPYLFETASLAEPPAPPDRRQIVPPNYLTV